MKNLIINISLLVCLIYTDFAYSQSLNDQDHLHIYNHRYWYYRWRLINDFMVVGNNMTSTYSFNNLKNTMI